MFFLGFNSLNLGNSPRSGKIFGEYAAEVGDFFGNTFWERYENMEDVKRLLEKKFIELKKSKPHLFKDMEI